MACDISHVCTVTTPGHTSEYTSRKVDPTDRASKQACSKKGDCRFMQRNKHALPTAVYVVCVQYTGPSKPGGAVFHTLVPHTRRQCISSAVFSFLFLFFFSVCNASCVVTASSVSCLG